MDLEFNDRVRVNDTYPIEAWRGRTGILTTLPSGGRWPYYVVKLDGYGNQYEFLAEELDKLETDQ